MKMQNDSGVLEKNWVRICLYCFTCKKFG